MKLALKIQVTVLLKVITALYLSVLWLRVREKDLLQFKYLQVLLQQIVSFFLPHLNVLLLILF